MLSLLLKRVSGGVTSHSPVECARCWGVVGNAVSSVVSVGSKPDGLENDDRLPFRNALVDLVGQNSDSQSRWPCGPQV
jgi:hypothetical protein